MILPSYVFNVIYTSVYQKNRQIYTGIISEKPWNAYNSFEFFLQRGGRTKAVTQKTLRLFNVERVKGALQLQDVFYQWRIVYICAIL